MGMLLGGIIVLDRTILTMDLIWVMAGLMFLISSGQLVTFLGRLRMED